MVSRTNSSKVFGLFIFLCINLCAIIATEKSVSEWAKNEEIEIFRQYLRFQTVHPNVDYKPTVEFLKQQAAALHLPVVVYYPANKDNPVVVMTWEGSQPELPSIMLNSHMDVVPVYEEYWMHPPFAAEMEENGYIFARGSQDTKNVGMQYLATIRALKRRGINQLKRTIYITFVPDEEMGGYYGMRPFVKSDAFKAMNVVFVLDESGAVPGNILPAFYAERTIWQIEFIFHGHSGHASMLFEGTPGEKLNYVVGKMMEYRKEEVKKLKFVNGLPIIGNVTSINLTILKGGIEVNVIPAEFSATFDIRVSPNTDMDELEHQIRSWCDEAGGNITINGNFYRSEEVPTRTDDSNPFWVELKNGVIESGFELMPAIFPAGSDMRYVRELNISAISFAPLMHTDMRAHDHNEYLNAGIYLKGIEVYENIIPRLGNL